MSLGALWASVTVIESVHRELGATFRSVGGVRVADHYGRPERAHLAARNAVGLVEPPAAVVAVPDDRASVADLLSVSLPDADDRAVFGYLVADGGGNGPDPVIRGEATVLVAEERLLCLCSPGARDWLLSRVAGHDRTGELGVFGVHGPQATEKVAGVLHGAGAPDARGDVGRGRMDEAGVTVVRTEDPAGEEGFEVLCAAADAEGVHDTLLVRGPNAAPVGYRTWETLTLEAGTPLPADLVGRPPSVLERDAPAGTPQFVGLAPATVPDAGATVCDADDSPVGTVTRAAASPSLDRPLALAVVARDAGDDLAVADEDRPPVSASVRSLPFYDGSAVSGRLPATARETAEDGA